MPRASDVSGSSAAQAGGVPHALGKAPKRTGRWRRWLWAALALLLLSAGGGVLGFYLVVSHFSQGLPSVEALKAGYDPPQTSRILAADGTILSSVFTERRTVIPFSDIPSVTKLAFLAAEDAHFYEHEGLNYFGLLRAMWANLRAGGIRQGGSTITQQVVKIILLDHSRSYRRKLQDMILAHRLEKHLSKDEIFGLYLNHLTMGHGRYGIEEAARYYFGKPASQLDANESATLAGIVPSPERYSPRRSPERALIRRNFVLQQMLEKGFITREYYDELHGAPPPRLAVAVDTQSSLCPEAVDAAKKALAEARKEVGNQGGYSVKTTIRPELQVAARQAIRDALDEYASRHGLEPPYDSKAIRAWGKPFKGTPRPNRVYVGVVSAVHDDTGLIDVQVGNVTGQVLLADEERYNPKHLPPSQFAIPGAVLRVRLAEAIHEGDDTPPRLRLELGPQGALVAIDVQSRDVVALVGSYEAVPGNLDRARQARRQPGSSFKPIVYAYALRAREVTAASVLDLTQDGPGTTDSPPYRISIRNALAVSNNEAAVQLLQVDGPENVVAYARELGVESKLGADLSLALGSYEVTPLEMANAFATFASGGYYEPARLVSEVLVHGEVALTPPREPRRKVLEAEEAYLVTSLLESVVTSGTGKRALKIGYPVAGKTGTTNDSKDAWFVGYSTDLAVAVWIGYDDALPLGDDEGGSKTALPAFVSFMTAAHVGRPRTEFPKPPGIVVAQVDPETGLLPRPGQADAITEEFLDGTVPVQVAPEPLPDIAAEMTYKAGPGDPHEPSLQ